MKDEREPRREIVKIVHIEHLEYWIDQYHITKRYFDWICVPDSS